MKLRVGAQASVSKTLSEGDIITFAELVGDFNPVHLDEQVAEHTRFGRKIAHGMLVASLISSVIGNRLPGPGSIYLQQDLRFEAPVYVGDTVTANVKVVSIRPDKPIVSLETVCRNQDGKVVISGQAVVLFEAAVLPFRFGEAVG